MIPGVLDKTLTLQRQTAVQDAIGGNTPTWATVTSMGSVPCCVAPVSWKTSQEFSRTDMVVEHEIYTQTNIGAQTRDRILIGSTYYGVLAYKSFEQALIGNLYVTIVGKRNQ